MATPNGRRYLEMVLLKFDIPERGGRDVYATLRDDRIRI